MFVRTLIIEKKVKEKGNSVSYLFYFKILVIIIKQIFNFKSSSINSMH
jgi:hypothetical protein